MKVIVIGSTGTFAKAIIKALISPEHKEHFNVTVFVRPETLKSSDPKKKEILDMYLKNGVRFVEGDVMTDTIDQLAEKIKGHDVIVSLVHYPILKDGQLKLIEAAKKADINWFIPSEFGMSNADYGRGNPFGYDEKLDVQEALKKSELNWTIICTGICTDLIYPNGPFIDIKNRVIKAPKSFENKFTHTCLKDVGGLLAQVLLHQDDDVKNRYLYMGAETISYEQVAQTLEKHLGYPFRREILNEETVKDQNFLTR